ncbi:MAG TPA: hypothetical protein VK181_04375 [Rhizobium sp.]|nr:hypothetical protein [Rhizobium sp.]
MPRLYDVPLRDINGRAPTNDYFYFTDWWWANKQFGYSVDCRWNFGIVALADGRFSVDGCVYAIEKNNCNGHWEKHRPCVYDTREQAIRVAAARLIRIARASRRWTGLFTGKLEGERLALVVNWIRAVVARETSQPTPTPITIYEPPKPRPKTGLPLFDL